MIYITGDTHADFSRFSVRQFPQQQSMTREDSVIICGDFGGVWDRSEQRQHALDVLNERPFTTLFLTGNHENYDLLEEYPVGEWHGGRVQFIREHVIHLLRGQVYTIEGKTFFAMGGAACHDIYNGVLDPDDPEFEEKYISLRTQRKFFRVNHHSWWAQELPTQAELDEGWANLLRHDKKVDYVLTHCAPTAMQRRIQAVTGDDTHPENELTDFLQRVHDECAYAGWYCGHYHRPMTLDERFHVLYEPVETLEPFTQEFLLRTLMEALPEEPEK